MLTEHPEVAPVAPAWLHATVQRLDGVDSAGITAGQRDALAAAL